MRIKYVHIINDEDEWEDIPFEEFRKEILMGRPKKSDPSGGRSGLRHSDKHSSGPGVPDRFKSENVYPDRKTKNNKSLNPTQKACAG